MAKHVLAVDNVHGWVQGSFQSSRGPGPNRLWACLVLAFGGGSNGGVADNGAKVWLADPGSDTYRFKAYWGAVPTDFDGNAEVHVNVLCSVRAGS